MLYEELNHICTFSLFVIVNLLKNKNSISILSYLLLLESCCGHSSESQWPVADVTRKPQEQLVSASVSSSVIFLCQLVLCVSVIFWSYLYVSLCQKSYFCHILYASEFYVFLSYFGHICMSLWSCVLSY